MIGNKMNSPTILFTTMRSEQISTLGPLELCRLQWSDDKASALWSRYELFPVPATPWDRAIQQNLWKFLHKETGTQGGCRHDFTSTSVLFIFASLQYYQLLLHMDDPYCALVKWYHIMLLCFYHQTLLMKKSPGLPRFICSIYFPKTLFWIKHLR